MRILICHERFVFRFGADRVFILVAERLRALGFHVTLLGARFDTPLLSRAADEMIHLPLPRDYHRCDEFCSRWVETDLPGILRGRDQFDLIIHGGWPLFGATQAFRRMSPRVLFFDHGVVPTDGYPAYTSSVLENLHALRRRHLPACTHAIGVSRFIIESQTGPDVGPKVPVRAILNGTDHLELPVAQPAATEHASLGLVRQLREEGHPLILNLGRIECGTYKNSQAAMEVFHLVRSAVPRARLLLLETAENLQQPFAHVDGVIPLGFPPDEVLRKIIEQVQLGVSVSLWEGFNLPLVELLRLDTPALALDIGAHSEVVPDPWFLANDTCALAAKAVVILNNPAIARDRLTSESARAHWQKLTWVRFVDEMLPFVGLAPAAP